MKLVIEGVPIHKIRHKCACRGGKAISYDPQSHEVMGAIRSKILDAYTRMWESEDKQIVMEASNLTKAESYDVTFTFVFSPPDSELEGKRNAKLWGLTAHSVKPDFDNLAKMYADCATGILWDNDAKITTSLIKKKYAENPRTEIEVVAKKDLSMHPSALSVVKLFSPSELKEFLKDVNEFWAWPPQRVDEIMGQDATPEKEKICTSLCSLILEFAHKHHEKLRKLKKIEALDLEKSRNILSQIEEGKLKVGNS